MIKGYYVKPNFFTGNPQEQDVEFYLTDGGCTAEYTPIMRITDVFVSINYNTQTAWIVVPKAYGQPFMTSINLTNPTGLNRLEKAFYDVKEWLGYSQQWRKVGRAYKHLHLITVKGDDVDVRVIEGLNQ